MGYLQATKFDRSSESKRNVTCYIVVEPYVPLGTRLDGKVWWHGITDHQNPSRRGVATTSVESAGLEPSSVDDLHIVSSKKRPPNTPQQKGRSHLEQQSNTDDTTPRKGKKKKKQKKMDGPIAASTAIATQCYFE